jgi:ATP-binding cassette subfamily B protein
VIGERGYSLSGGQRQRLAIARTILANPPLLVLDDATSAVDVSMELSIYDAFRTLMKDRTTIVIAHRISTIALADRVLVLHDGGIVADGTHMDLLRTSHRYRAILAQAEEQELLGGALTTEWDDDSHGSNATIAPERSDVRR